MFEQLFFRSPTFVGQGGIAEVRSPELFGIDLGIIGDGPFPRRIFGLVMLGFVVACALMVANIRRSSLGRRFLAVRINERAAAAAGINVARTKLLGAALASFLAAVAGVMFAYKSGGSFNGGGLEAQTGLEALALGYLGGVGYVSGAVIGGLLAPSGLAIALITGGSPVGEPVPRHRCRADPGDRADPRRPRQPAHPSIVGFDELTRARARAPTAPSPEAMPHGCTRFATMRPVTTASPNHGDTARFRGDSRVTTLAAIAVHPVRLRLDRRSMRRRRR